MSRIVIVLIALLAASFCANASTDVATFTPRWMGSAQWHQLGQDDSRSFWYDYAIDPIGCNTVGDRGASCATVDIVVKVAEKGLGEGYTGLSVIRGKVICSSQLLPDTLFDGAIYTYSLHTDPISMDSVMPLDHRTALHRDTWIAKAVVIACRSIYPSH